MEIIRHNYVELTLLAVSAAGYMLGNLLFSRGVRLRLNYRKAGMLMAALLFGWVVVISLEQWGLPKSLSISLQCLLVIIFFALIAMRIDPFHRAKDDDNAEHPNPWQQR